MRDPEAGPVLEAREVCKTYTGDGDVISALRNIDLSVERGEFVTIMGPSGSGKSTLLHVLGGLIRPTSGMVTVAGQSLADLDDKSMAEVHRRRVGFIFQAFNLVPVLSAFENVALPAAIAGVPASEYGPRVQSLLEKVGLADRDRKQPSQLSGGEQQRVAIARALVMDPDVVLADEPTGNLDSRSGRDILSLLRGLNSVGTTLLLVTHDPKIASLGGRILFMRDGSVVDKKKLAPDDLETVSRVEQLMDFESDA